MASWAAQEDCLKTSNCTRHYIQLMKINPQMKNAQTKQDKWCLADEYVCSFCCEMGNECLEGAQGPLVPTSTFQK